MPTMKLEVFSKEMIKPSFVSPHRLNSTYETSILGKFMPDVYIPLILFYSSGGNDYCIDKLKKSLSEILTYLYPLAGRIKDESCSEVECSNEGAEFSDARVVDAHLSLSEFLQTPISSDVLAQMVPGINFRARSASDPLLAVQANRFECGGLAIGICLHHKAADGASLGILVDWWARAAAASEHRGLSPPPDLISSALFPWVDGVEGQVDWPRAFNLETKRFVFTASNIAALKSRSAEQPTRYEAVSALVWKCLSKARGGDLSVSMQSVNVRPRTLPPIPENAFGNFVVMSPATAKKEEWEEDMPLERQIRAAVRKIDGAYIKQYQSPSPGESLKVADQECSEKDGNEFSTFSKWCRFPFYEADFGWGNPIWVSMSTMALNNMVVFLNTRSGDGIEAWMHLEEEIMAKVAQDEELLSFVSIPSPMG